MKLEMIMTCHRGPVTDVKVTSDRIYSASADGTVAIYDHKGEYLSRLCGTHTKGLSAIAIDGNTLVSAGNDFAAVWNL